MEFETLSNCVVRGDAQGAEHELRRALAGGSNPNQILSLGLIAAMDTVGQKFSNGEFFTPEMIVAARAMKHCLAILKPLLVDTETVSLGTVVLGSVKGDLHDIGKSLVGMMLEGSGFSVKDLGVDVAPEVFVSAVREHQPSILGLSCLLTTTMPRMTEVIAALQSAGLRDDVKVMIGGAPVTEQFAQLITADAYATDAAAAARKAKELVRAA